MRPEVVELLFQVHPLIALVKGERRDDLRAAWIAVARNQANNALPAMTPATKRETAEALAACCIEISRGLGVNGVDLADWFNDKGTSVAIGDIPDVAAALERGLALLLHLAVQRQGEAPATSPAGELRLNA